MTKEVFNLGTAPNSGNGDSVQVAFTKVAHNFDELYTFSNSTSTTLTLLDGRIVLANSNTATLRADFMAQSVVTQTAIGLLNANVASLNATVVTNLATSKQYAQDVANVVQANVNVLASTVSLQANSATAGLNDLLARITAANAVTSSLSVNAVTTNNRIGALENSVVILGGMASNVAALVAHDISTDSAISNLLTRAGLADNAIMALSGTVTSLSGNTTQSISDINNRANGISTTLAALTDTVTTHGNSITTLGQKIDTTNANAVVLDARANSITNAVVAVDNRVTATQTTAANLAVTVATVRDTANAATLVGTQNRTRIEVAENAITTQASVTANAIAVTNANIVLLSANTASGFMISNAKMDAINAVVSALSANGLGDAAIINARLNAAAAHANATNNPHSVTPAQIGAIPTSMIGAAAGIAELDSFGKLKFNQRPSYGYSDFITGTAQIDLLPGNAALKLGSAAQPWANVHTTVLNANAVLAASLDVPGLSTSNTAVTVSRPLRLTNVTDDIVSVNGSIILTRPDANSVLLRAANTVVLSSGTVIDGHITAGRGDAIVAAQDEVVMYSNLRAGWASRKEIRFSNVGALIASTFTLAPTVNGLEFTAQDFIITSDKVTINTAKPLIVSAVELSYGGNSVYHAGNFTPASKVNVTDYTSAAVLAKIISVAGPGSFLDADLLDGQHGAFYREFSNINNRPTTLDGYGITDAMRANASVNAALLNGQAGSYYRDFANLTNRPTTLAGYGITDGAASSARVTSFNALASNGVIVLTGNAVTSLSVGAASATSVIDRQTGDARYVQATTANLADGYLKLDSTGKIPSSILPANAVTSVASLTGAISATDLKGALALSPADISGLTAILADKVSKSESTWSPVTATGTGSSQNITLPQTGLSPSHVMVTITGIVQDTTEYSISGTTLTMTAPSGAGIMVRRFGVGPSLVRTASIQFVIDGNGMPVSTGIKGDITIPFDCTIVGWTLLADVMGSISVELWKSSFAASPPIASGKITGTNPPVLVGQSKNKSTSLATWSPAVTADDVIRVSINSSSTVTRVTLSLTVII